MRLVIQRVSEAQVVVDEQIIGKINQGLLVLIGIEPNDTDEDESWLIRKLINLRIFGDENGVMNCSVKDIEGEFLIVSQFTLHASTKKGNRPSYIRAAQPDIAIPRYENFVENLKKQSQLKVETGKFGADMKVSLLNDGPVTIIMDSKRKE